MRFILKVLLVSVSGVAVAGVLASRRGQRIEHPDPETFIIKLDDDLPERFLPLESAVNFRDIGGYRTADGRRVRTGKVYRAGALNRLTDSDRELLARMGMKLVCDLRSQEEVEEEPDRLPDNPAPEYLHLPLKADDDRLRRLRALLFNRRQIALMLPEMYTDIMIDRNANICGEVLRRLSEPENLPTIIHCTAGKDRTGVVVALLLSLLGVPDDIILADYSLSNRFFPTFLAYGEKTIHPVAWLGVKAEDIQPLLVADPQTMRTALAHVRSKYSSVENYLRDAAGLDEGTLGRLRENLLE
jgi:protein-tyrosine phosphatase